MKQKKKAKILVVENQIYQFRKIQDYLLEARRFDLYPRATERSSAQSAGSGNGRGEDAYLDFTDAVRVYLNWNFEIGKRDRAFERIIAEIDLFDPDIFLVDQVLVGNYHGKRGTYLARKIFEQLGEKKARKPMVFLSRTDPNTQETKDDLDELSKLGITHKWVAKGFSGLAILEHRYFEKYVIKDAIESLLDERGPVELESKIKLLQSQNNAFNSLGEETKEKFFRTLVELRDSESPDPALADCVLGFNFSPDEGSIRDFVNEFFCLSGVAEAT